MRARTTPIRWRSLIPYERIEMEYALPKEVMIERLAAVTARKRWWNWRMPFGKGSFRGEVTSEGFYVERVIHFSEFRNPVIVMKGRFSRTETGTLLTVRMTMDGFTVACLSLWFSCAILMSIAAAFFGPVTNSLFLLAPLLLGLPAYLAVILAFRHDAARSERLLKQVLEDKRE